MAVPLTRRNLFAEPRRLVAAAVGVGLAVMLILLLDGLWAGVRSQVTRYSDRAGAALFVVPPGSRLLFTDYATLPASIADDVARVDGVDWVAPVRGQYAIVELHGRKVAVSLIGSIPGERGGAWSLAEGRAPEADDEAVIDSVVARRHGLDVGETVDLLGRDFRIVGLSSDTAGFMTGFVFVTHEATDELLQSPGTTSAVLVGTKDAGRVQATLQARGLEVLDRDEVRAEGVALATRIYGTPLRLMVAVAFAAGTLVIALTVYTAIAERRREFGIVKAMGASGGRLARLALAQSLAVGGLGLAAGGVLFVVGRAAIVSARPQFAVVLTANSVIRAASAAVVMAVLAAVFPARRLARLDPATAYRGAG